jgi:hypothetical protein
MYVPTYLKIGLHWNPKLKKSWERLFILLFVTFRQFDTEEKSAKNSKPKGKCMENKITWSIRINLWKVIYLWVQVHYIMYIYQYVSVLCLDVMYYLCKM